MARQQARGARAQGALSAGAAAVAFVLGLAPAAVANAETFQVTNLNDSGAGSLRQAISDANNAPELDEITFTSGLTGTITLTGGSLGIWSPVDIQGPGADVLTVSGNENSQVFYLYTGSSTPVTLSGLRITEGKSSWGGGGIAAYDSSLTLNRVKIDGNSATNHGGGLWADGFNMTLEIHESEISGNTAGGKGGGVYVEDTGGALVIEDSIISGNAAGGHGGGIYFYDPDHSVTIERTTIANNTAVGAGGGVGLYSMDAGTFTIRNSTFANNQASKGGGLFIEDSDQTVAISGSTFSGNLATSGAGGAVHLDGLYSDFTISHTTIVNNQADTGGGGIYAAGQSVALDHCILAANSASSGNPDFDGSSSFQLSYSLVGPTGTATVSNLVGSQLNVTSLQLSALGDYGGPTQTHLPLPGSPALNAGLSALGEGAPSTDQRGQPRLVGSAIDIGAVELNAGQVSCVQAEVQISESAGAVQVVLARAGGFDGVLPIKYTTVDGSAKAPGDYTAQSGTLQWPTGAESQVIAITLADNELVHAQRRFSLRLSADSAGLIGESNVCTIVITDDDSTPAIVAPADQVTQANQATAVLAFTVSDADQSADDLTVTASSSNQDLVPDANIVLGGAGENRTVQVTPRAGATGAAVITLSVSDGENSVSQSFTLTVEAAEEEEPGTGGGTPKPEQPGTDDGESPEEMEARKKGGGGCSTQGTAPTGSLWSMLGVLGLFGLAGRKRRAGKASKSS